jgi:hypothetical protein
MAISPHQRKGGAGRRANMARADRHAADLAPTIAEIEATGVTTLRGIAMALNARNIPTPTGRKEWQAIQVRRVLARL